MKTATIRNVSLQKNSDDVVNYNSISNKTVIEKNKKTRELLITNERKKVAYFSHIIRIRNSFG